MIRFKMLFTLLKLFFFAFLLGNVVSCVKAQKQQTPGTSTNRVFRFSRNSDQIVDLTGYAADQIASQNITATRVAFTGTVSDQARYGNQREYNLTMCGLVDVRAPGNPLLGQKFEIFSELPVAAKPDGGSIATVQNDNCLYWTTSFTFDPIGASVNLYVNFVFRAVSGAKTYIHRTVIINPWDQQRGSNPEFFDFTRHGLSSQTSQLPMAMGPNDIALALAGDFKESNRQLEIGSVQFVPVKKDVKTGAVTLPASPDEARSFVTGTIGDLTNQDFKRINDLRRSALSESGNSELQNLQTIDLNLNIRLADLKVRLADSAGVVGSSSDMPLPTGQYKISAQVVASDANPDRPGAYYIISSRVPYNSSDVPGHSSNVNAPAQTLWNTQTMGVNAVLPLSLVARPMWGNIQLVLKVEPAENHLRLKPFEAVYYLGTFDSIGAGSSPIFDLAHFNRDTAGNISFNAEEYLKKASNYREWINGRAEDGIIADTIERGFRRFRFTHLEVLFSRIVPGDTSTDRTIQYTVKTCLQETAFGLRPQAGLKFDITTEDRGIKTTIAHKTDDQGCLSWVGLISHKFYQRESLVLKESILSFVGDGGQRQTQTLKYYINPWDEKFTFGRDERVLPSYYIEQINEGQKFAPPTKILITNFHYDAIGFRYVVDKYMNLTVKKTVLMDIHPKVLKYNSIIWGRSGFVELRDGIYLLKVAMQKDYLDPAAPGRRIEVDERGHYRIPYNEHDSKTRRVFITIKEVLVRVLGGHIITPIEFDINDLRTLRLRSQMFIQLETIDEMLLRAVMLVDKNLTESMNASTQLTLDIVDRQLSEEEMARQTNQLLEEARRSADRLEIQQRLQDLYRSRSGNIDQLRQLLSSLNPEVAQSVFTDLSRLGREGDQSPESAQGNLRYAALDRYLDVTKKIVREFRQMGVVQQEQVKASYAQEKRNECRVVQQSLERRGETELAARYNPDVPNTLCPLDIPADQMFYFLISRTDLGSERWLEQILDAREIEILKNSLFPGHSGNINNEIINVLRDDFTEAYRPNYDFNLLSNEGDEMADGADPRFVSGLARRTFMGPVTFVLNGNGSAVRPTDVLDEAFCGRTCEQLSSIELDQVVASSVVQSTLNEVRNFGNDVNAAYEKNPYFGYVGQFYKKQVNDLIPMFRGVNRIYKEEMEAFSKDGYFVDSMMLTHVRFGQQNADSLKSIDPMCFGAWKNDIEKLYEQWRDLNATSLINIDIPPIPANCFKQTRRSLDPRRFMDRINAIVPERHRNEPVEKDPYWFSRPSNHYDYAARPVSASEMKEFAKNGVRSVRLSLAQKENILHHICYLVRETVSPKGAQTVRRILRDERGQGPINNSGFSGAGFNFSNFLNGKLGNMEKSCHQKVDAYMNKVKSVSSLSPKDQAILMSDLTLDLPFAVERRIRVLDTTDRYVYQDGKTLNYSVSKSFGMGGGFSTGRGRKVEFDFDKILGGLGSAMAVGGIAFMIGGPVPAVIATGTTLLVGGGSALLGFNIEWRESEGMGIDNGTSVSSGTTLAAQISTLDIELKEFEKCIVIRPTTEFLLETKRDIDEENDWIDHDTSDNFRSYKFMNEFTNMGYFVCSGDIQTEDDLNTGNPLRVRERYYYFTQIFNDGDMQDPGELVNHPWMLMLRGERDFAVFEQALMAPIPMTWGEARDQRDNDLAYYLPGGDPGASNNRVSGATLHGMPTIDRGDYEVVGENDISLALDMMQKGFERALPAVPGMYTFSDFESGNVIHWPQGSNQPRRATPAHIGPRGGR